MRMKFGAVLTALTIVALTAVSSFAGTINLGIAGDARVGQDYIEFGVFPFGGPYSPAPGLGVFEVTAPVTGFFAANGVTPGQYGSIQSFDSTMEGAGTPISPAVEFMTFSSGGSNLEVFLTELYQGSLPIPPPSPFILSDTETGATADFGVAGYVLNSNDNSQTPFTGIFSATFSGITADQLVGSLPVDTAFSATLSATPTPEPASLLLFGIGLLGTGIFGPRRLSRD
jgi:hypothetical protein